MRSYFYIILCCFWLFSCKKSEDGSGTLKLSHYQDTIGARLILKGGPFSGALTDYTVIFNDRETGPSQRISPTELEVVVPVHARSGAVILKGPKTSYQSIDTFYVTRQQRWKQAAIFPGEGRILATAFVIGSKAYVATGANKYNGNYFKDLWEYDNARDTWSKKADFPGATRYMTMSFVLNGKGYVGGGIYSPGYSCAQDLYEYTPESNTWKKMATPPSATDLCYGSALAYREQGYVLSEAEGKKTLVFDVVTNSWNTRASWNLGRLVSQGASFVLGDKLYFGLGSAQIPWSGQGDFINSNIYSYSHGTNAWKYEDQHTPSPEQSVYRNAFVHDGEAYMAFGDAGQLYAYNPVYKYWRKVASQKLGVASDCSTFMIGSRGFVVFGHMRFDDPGTRKLWVIELNTDPVVR